MKTAILIMFYSTILFTYYLSTFYNHIQSIDGNYNHLPVLMYLDVAYFIKVTIEKDKLQVQFKYGHHIITPPTQLQYEY